MIKAEQRRCLEFVLFLGAFAKLRKATIDFIMSVRPSVRSSVRPSVRPSVRIEQTLLSLEEFL
jgi:hypothetical protein